MNLQEILALPVIRYDLNKEIPLRDYLFALNVKLWQEQEGFNAKRPWGNGGWAFDVYLTLIKHKLINGTLDENGYIDEIDEPEAEAFVIEKLIKPLFCSSTATFL